MITDPVCGMRVDEKNQEHQSQYGVQEYTFCSEECKKKFDENPEHYARSAA